MNGRRIDHSHDAEAYKPISTFGEDENENDVEKENENDEVYEKSIPEAREA